MVALRCSFRFIFLGVQGSFHSEARYLPRQRPSGSPFNMLVLPDAYDILRILFSQTFPLVLGHNDLATERRGLLALDPVGHGRDSVADA